jgi:hypothetical protein
MSEQSVLPPLDLDVDIEALERAAAPTLRERTTWRLHNAADRIRGNGLDIAVVGLLSVVALWVHMHGMYDSPARFDDEGTYTAYAWAVQYEHQLGHYTYWYAHPPLGWIQMAFWNWITGAMDRAPYAVAGMRQLMVVSKLVSVVLLYGLALRLRLTRVAAAGAVLLFALSPLAVYFTRTALLDNIVTPWLIGAFFLAASPRRTLRAAVGSAACFAVAVLTKETALLFLPALALLLWQCTDRRNRRFGVTMFGSALLLILLVYPTYALVKNELLQGQGHVSLEWAVRWQLFGRQGSGSIFDQHSTAHAVTTSWLILDPWTTRAALLAIVPGLMFRRTRAITLAFGIQAAELLRSGYLPYPFVIAMIPFGALVLAGALDLLWQGARVRLPVRVTSTRIGAWLADDRPARRSVLDARPSRLRRRLIGRLRRAQPVDGELGDRPPGRLATTRTIAAVAVRIAVAASVVVAVVLVSSPWRARLDNLLHDNRDAGAAAALAWTQTNVRPDERVVVDDAFWVDLVRHGHPQNRTIWFTKLDVDPDVRLPSHPQWKSIDYVVLGYQDEMSLHLTLDGKASPATVSQFPTLGQALNHGRIVAAFGSGQDRVLIWRVDPSIKSGG